MNQPFLIQLAGFFAQKKTQYISLLVLILCLYFKVIFFDFNLDDYIITDAIAGKTNTIKEVFGLFKLSYNHTDYRPIVLLSYGFEQFLFGEIKPAVSHSINLILYFFVCASALNLFQILFDKKYNLLLFSAVVLFCVHPLNTEVVCSLKCRDNLLSMFFGLNAALFFILFLEEKSKQTFYLCLFLLSAITAVLSKMDAIGFLLFCIAYTLFYKKEKKIIYGIVSAIIIFIVLNLTSYIQTTALSQQAVIETLKGKVTFTENPLALEFTMANRCIAFINTIYFYFIKLIPVSGFRYYYGYNYYDVLSTNTLSFFSGILLLISFIALFILALKKQDKILLVSVIGIFVLSFYALNFYLPVAGIVADRYVFMANLFFCLMITYLIQMSFVFLKRPLHRQAFIFIVILFTVLSTLRIPAWRNFKTLIDTDAPKLYSSYEAMRIASGAYYKEYEAENDISIKKTYLEKSIFYAEKGVQVYPENYLLFLFLGQYYFKANEPKKAIQALRTSIKNDTSTIDAFVYLGDAYYSLKKTDSALFFYKNGLHIDPKSQLLINNISTVYYEMNDKDNCLKFNLDLIHKDSSTFAAHENLGYFYLNAKDTAKATEYFKNAVKFGLDANSLPISIQ
ncbi:MAG: hypothetical protein U0U67_17635 [Chitinophagales bacterium]